MSDTFPSVNYLVRSGPMNTFHVHFWPPGFFIFLHIWFEAICYCILCVLNSKMVAWVVKPVQRRRPDKSAQVKGRARHRAPPNSFHVITTIFKSNIWFFGANFFMLHMNGFWDHDVDGENHEKLFLLIKIRKGGMRYIWIKAENFFSFIAIVLALGYFFSRSWCFNAWCLIAHLLAFKRSFLQCPEKEGFWGAATPPHPHLPDIQKHSLPRLFLLHRAPQCIVLQYFASQCNEEEGRSPIIEPFPDDARPPYVEVSQVELRRRGAIAHTQSVQWVNPLFITLGLITIGTSN